jgi:hypothetical protein
VNKLVRTGRISVRPSRDPYRAFQREIKSLLEDGHEREAFGLCVGLAIISLETVEEIWERETTTHALI